MRVHFRFLAVIILATLPARSHADIAPNPITGGWPISPYDSTTTDVRMVAEDVVVKIYPDSVVTAAVFSMRNDGKTTDMVVGFPFSRQNDVLAFRVFVDGNRTRVRDGSKTSQWKIWDMTFRKGQPCEVRVEYKTMPYEIGGYYFREDTHPGLPPNLRDTLNRAMVSRHAEYILDTGRAWKGTLDHCKISFELVGLTAGHIGRYQPEDGVVTDNRIAWTYARYEPRGLVNIEYLPVLSKEERKNVFLQAVEQFPDDARLVSDAGRLCDWYSRDSNVEYELYDSFLTKWNKPIPQLMEYAPGGRCRVNLKAEGGFFRVLSMANTLFKRYQETGQLEKGRHLAPKLSLMSTAVLDSLATCSGAEQSTAWLVRDATLLRDLCNGLIKNKQ